MLWMAEWSEILMSLTSNWNAGDSSGEGLSHYCALQLFLSGHNEYYTPANNQIFVQNWLNGDGTTNPGTTRRPTRARSDWVNTPSRAADGGRHARHGDGDPVSYGCALAFIYYLTTQLGFTINEVIAKYYSNLASCYHGVTATRPTRSRGSSHRRSTSTRRGRRRRSSGTNPNNPFPIAQVEFYAQKNTFGKDEAQDIINHQGGLDLVGVLGRRSTG